MKKLLINILLIAMVFGFISANPAPKSVETNVTVAVVIDKPVYTETIDSIHPMDILNLRFK